MKDRQQARESVAHAFRRVRSMRDPQQNPDTMVPRLAVKTAHGSRVDLWLPGDDPTVVLKNITVEGEENFISGDIPAVCFDQGNTQRMFVLHAAGRANMGSDDGIPQKLGSGIWLQSEADPGLTYRARGYQSVFRPNRLPESPQTPPSDFDFPHIILQVGGLDTISNVVFEAQILGIVALKLDEVMLAYVWIQRPASGAGRESRAQLWAGVPNTWKTLLASDQNWSGFTSITNQQIQINQNAGLLNVVGIDGAEYAAGDATGRASSSRRRIWTVRPDIGQVLTNQLFSERMLDLGTTFARDMMFHTGSRKKYTYYASYGGIGSGQPPFEWGANNGTLRARDRRDSPVNEFGFPPEPDLDLYDGLIRGLRFNADSKKWVLMWEIDPDAILRGVLGAEAKIRVYERSGRSPYYVHTNDSLTDSTKDFLAIWISGSRVIDKSSSAHTSVGNVHADIGTDGFSSEAGYFTLSTPDAYLLANDGTHAIESPMPNEGQAISVHPESLALECAAVLILVVPTTGEIFAQWSTTVTPEEEPEAVEIDLDDPDQLAAWQDLAATTASNILGAPVAFEFTLQGIASTRQFSPGPAKTQIHNPSRDGFGHYDLGDVINEWGALTSPPVEWPQYGVFREDSHIQILPQVGSLESLGGMVADYVVNQDGSTEQGENGFVWRRQQIFKGRREPAQRRVVSNQVGVDVAYSDIQNSPLPDISLDHADYWPILRTIEAGIVKFASWEIAETEDGSRTLALLWTLDLTATTPDGPITPWQIRSFPEHDQVVLMRMFVDSAGDQTVWSVSAEDGITIVSAAKVRMEAAPVLEVYQSSTGLFLRRFLLGPDVLFEEDTDVELSDDTIAHYPAGHYRYRFTPAGEIKGGTDAELQSGVPEDPVPTEALLTPWTWQFGGFVDRVSVTPPAEQQAVAQYSLQLLFDAVAGNFQSPVNFGLVVDVGIATDSRIPREAQSLALYKQLGRSLGAWANLATLTNDKEPG